MIPIRYKWGMRADQFSITHSESIAGPGQQVPFIGYPQGPGPGLAICYSSQLNFILAELFRPYAPEIAIDIAMESSAKAALRLANRHWKLVGKESISKLPLIINAALTFQSIESPDVRLAIQASNLPDPSSYKPLLDIVEFGVAYEKAYSRLRARLTKGLIICAVTGPTAEIAESFVVAKLTKIFAKARPDAFVFGGRPGTEAISHEWARSHFIPTFHVRLPELKGEKELIRKAEMHAARCTHAVLFQGRDTYVQLLTDAAKAKGLMIRRIPQATQ